MQGEALYGACDRAGNSLLFFEVEIHYTFIGLDPAGLTIIRGSQADNQDLQSKP